MNCIVSSLLECYYSNKGQYGHVTMVMKVLAGGHNVAASIFFQATVIRGHHLLQTLDSITHVPRQALAFTFVLDKTNEWMVMLKREVRFSFSDVLENILEIELLELTKKLSVWSLRLCCVGKHKVFLIKPKKFTPCWSWSGKSLSAHLSWNNSYSSIVSIQSINTEIGLSVPNR